MLDRKRISILQVFHVILSSRSNSLTCCEDLGTCSGNHCKCASECVQLDMKAIQCIQHRGHLYYLCFGIFSEALHRRYKREPQTNQKLSTAARSATRKKPARCTARDRRRIFLFKLAGRHRDLRFSWSNFTSAPHALQPAEQSAVLFCFVNPQALFIGHLDLPAMERQALLCHAALTKRVHGRQDRRGREGGENDRRKKKGERSRGKTTDQSQEEGRQAGQKKGRTRMATGKRTMQRKTGTRSKKQTMNKV